jgi:hypothetical protein
MIRMKTMNWARELMDLFQNSNKEASDQAVTGLRSKYIGEFDTTILLDKLDHIQNPDPHWAFTSLPPMITVAICTFTVLLCICQICC